MSRDLTLVHVETGEHRPPRLGEFFRTSAGQVERARFNFSVQSFPILQEKLVEVSGEPEEKDTAK